jgi:rhodanese-related sulfurtransferase
MAHAPKFLKLVQAAKKLVKETNVPAVKQRMDAGEKFVLIDVREDNEWVKGHIAGAVHMGKGVRRSIRVGGPSTARMALETSCRLSRARFLHLREVRISFFNKISLVAHFSSSRFYCRHAER